MEILFKRLSEAIGYEIPVSEDTQLYYHLMALHVGTLANPDAKDRRKSLEIIVLLCEVCRRILDNRIKVQEDFLEAFAHED